MLYWGIVPILILLRVFINETTSNFVKVCVCVCVCIYWDDHKYLLFNLLISCLKLIGLLILNHPWICGINPTYSHCMILLICCWIVTFVYIFLWISASTVIKVIDLWFTFLWYLFLVLLSEWCRTCRMSLEVILSLHLFSNSLKIIPVNSSLNVL